VQPPVCFMVIMNQQKDSYFHSNICMNIVGNIEVDYYDRELKFVINSK